MATFWRVNMAELSGCGYFMLDVSRVANVQIFAPFTGVVFGKLAVYFQNFPRITRRIS